MNRRDTSPLDRLLAEVDNALRVSFARAHEDLGNPAGDTPEAELSDAERNEAAALMRVNHAGEISAQALYRGQALVARDEHIRTELLKAADEEHDHLAWCEHRVGELGSHTSFLAPFWYGGSFALGTVAGLAGDGISLGFLAETERQVTSHLDSHLERLPEQDERSRKIVEQMREDEIKHSTHAIESGGEELPAPVKQAMKLASKVMTTLAHRI